MGRTVDTISISSANDQNSESMGSHLFAHRSKEVTIENIYYNITVMTTNEY